MSVEEVIEKLIEEPWHGDKIIPPLSDADKATVRAALLAKIEEDGDDLESGVPAGLEWFADDEVVAALQKVIESDADSDVIEAAVESIGTIAETLPSARPALHALLEHDNEDVVKVAIKGLKESPEKTLELLLPRVDAYAELGEDMVMFNLVTKLVEAAPTHPGVIAALARHWDFSIKHSTTALAANKIFDTLIDHAPRSAEAQAAFAAAVAHEDEYGKVQGHGALALTTDDITANVKALKAMKGLKPSGSSLRKKALDKLVKTRRAELEKLAAAKDRTAASLLK